MATRQLPDVLRDRLGEDGAAALLGFLIDAHEDWTENVLTAAIDRFDGRLASELSGMHVETMREISSLRQEMTQEISSFRQEVTREFSSVRQDMTQEASSFRHEMMQEFSSFRQDMTRDLASVRVELLKWSFLFWVGQVAAMAGLLAFTLRR